MEAGFGQVWPGFARVDRIRCLGRFALESGWNFMGLGFKVKVLYLGLGFGLGLGWMGFKEVVRFIWFFGSGVIWVALE